MPYTTDDYLQVAEQIEFLPAHLMQSDFYQVREHMMQRLREAAQSPNDPRSCALMAGVKFVIYVPFTK